MWDIISISSINSVKTRQSYENLEIKENFEKVSWCIQMNFLTLSRFYA